MTSNDFTGAVPSATYHGFAGPPHAVSGGEKRRRTITLVGVATALALGLSIGMLAKPKLAVSNEEPMEPVVQTASTGPQLAIQVNRTTPPAVPAPPAAKAEKLEVLPVELAKAAPKPPVARTPVRYEADEPEFAPAPIDCAAPANGYEARLCDDAMIDDSAPQATELYGPEDY